MKYYYEYKYKSGTTFGVHIYCSKEGCRESLMKKIKKEEF